MHADDTNSSERESQSKRHNVELQHAMCQTFKYLGALITTDVSTDEEIKYSLQQGSKCLYALKELVSLIRHC